MKALFYVKIFAILLGMTAIGATLRAADEAPAAKPSPGLEALTAKDTPLKQGDSIAFFGDSVTMQGGFITMMRKALDESDATKGLDIKLYQHGLNGGRVPTVLEGKSPWGDLGGTMQELLDKEKPHVVVIYLGINDVWHQDDNKGTSKADYEAGLRKMVAMSKKIGAVTILCTPTIIGEETKNNKHNDMLGEYSQIVAKVAKDDKLILCDLHTAFINKLKEINRDNKHAGNLTYDGVHMVPAGNELLADQMSAAIVKALNAAPKKK